MENQLRCSLNNKFKNIPPGIVIAMFKNAPELVSPAGS